MPQLDPTWFASQLFWLVVSFSLLYLLLSRVILPPIVGIVGLRTQTIGSDLSQAENAKLQAEHAKQDYERALAQSREMAQALMNEVAEENKKHAEKTMKSLDGEISKKLSDAAAKITAKKQELIRSLTPEAAEFTAIIAEKITTKPSNKEQASRMVLEAMKARS